MIYQTSSVLLKPRTNESRLGLGEHVVQECSELYPSTLTQDYNYCETSWLGRGPVSRIM